MVRTMSNDWDAGKDQHKQLAAVAASSYDDEYSESNFATGLYMDFETNFIKQAIKQAPDDNIAIELGCGTGRHSFILAREFEQVRGYDFEEEMISVAEIEKHKRGIGNIAFETRDVEAEPLPEDDSTVSLVIASFGMGSFVKDFHEFMRKIRRVLKPQGLVVFSFYNSESLVLRLKNDLPWRGLSLSATYNTDTQGLEVDFGDRSFSISAKTYSHREIDNILRGNFTTEKLVTHPTISAILPDDLFDNSEAQELCETVDSVLASNEEIAGGAYILALCRKGVEIQDTEEIVGFEKILRLFRMHGIRPDREEHPPVHSLGDLESVLDTSRSRIVKNVIFVHESEGRKTYHAVVLTANKKVHVGKLSRVLKIPREEIRMATQHEVEEIMGFSVNHLPPFGFPKTSSITTLLDSSLEDHDELWCSVGRRTEHIKLPVSDLKTLASTFVFSDMSKPINE